MAMGRRKQRQESLFVSTADLARSPGHPFYRRLNGLLAAAEGGGPFDRGTAEQRPFRDELPRDARDRQRLRAALWDSLAFLRREARQPATPARRFTTADLLPPAES